MTYSNWCEYGWRQREMLNTPATTPWREIIINRRTAGLNSPAALRAQTRWFARITPASGIGGSSGLTYAGATRIAA